VGDVANVARGREVSIARVAELVARQCGRELSPRKADARPGDVLRHCADVRKAERLFGFAARVDLEEGLARTVDWFRREGLAGRADEAASSSPNW
jgi:nucleoside-diphosphate-sugar epimerase